MNPLIIVKLGSTFSDLARRRGDFEDWTAAMLPLPEHLIRTIDPVAGEALPRPTDCSGFILTGAHESVYNKLDWSETTAGWIRRVVAANVPLLGICYGHQLLAHAFGGTVGVLPSGPVFGTVRLNLTAAAARDSLFGVLGKNPWIQATHSDAVHDLPAGAVRLATTDRDPNHAFAIGAAAWGIQSHPEFDAEVVRSYIREFFAADQQEDLLATVTETADTKPLLDRFVAIASGSQG